MALIKCPECGTEVSDKAERCPKCSYPISQKDSMHETQVIEKTSKELKQQMIYGVVTIIAGFFFLASNYVTAGLILFGLGVVWLIITKCRIWWYHE